MDIPLDMRCPEIIDENIRVNITSRKNSSKEKNDASAMSYDNIEIGLRPRANSLKLEMPNMSKISVMELHRNSIPLSALPRSV